jgi:hypothetical protein
MKYILIFVICCCCPLHSNYLLSLCNGFSIAASARNANGELLVGCSAFVPEFQKHPLNNTVVAVISFSDVTRVQIRWIRRMEDYNCASNGQIGRLTKRYELAHCHVE